MPQHQQIVDWLATLPFVDSRADRFLRPVLRRQDGHARAGAGDRLLPVDLLGRFQRVGLEERLDAAARTVTSGTGEYEIFEFNLGNTFNYAEMAALIAPRPFMVERGHFDGVAADEQVAYEFAKVRFLYEAQLGIGDRTALEWFNGPHMIHGVGTFEFLRKWLGRRRNRGSGFGVRGSAIAADEYPRGRGRRSPGGSRRPSVGQVGFGFSRRTCAARETFGRAGGTVRRPATTGSGDRPQPGWETGHNRETAPHPASTAFRRRTGLQRIARAVGHLDDVGHFGSVGGHEVSASHSTFLPSLSASGASHTARLPSRMTSERARRSR